METQKLTHIINIKLALFDFNGTVLDDIPIWYKAMSKIFETAGKEPPTIEEFYTDMKKDYLHVYRSRGITMSRNEMNVIYGNEYNRLVHTATLSHGALNTLTMLKKKDIKLGLSICQ